MESVIGRVFISCCIFIVLFIGLDIASRPFLSNRSQIEKKFPVVSSRYPRPYVMFSGKPHADQLNELGYIGPAPKIPKPNNEYRIICLGGSTIINGDPPLPELIQNQFNHAGMEHVRVYNFGVISSVSGMELVKIATQAVDYQPDLIVMYNGGNDLTQPIFSDPRPGYPFNFMVYEYNPLLESDIKDYPGWTLFLYGSNIMRTLFPKYFAKKFLDVTSLRKNVHYNTPEWKNAIARTYVQNLIKSHHIARAFGADFIGFIQPTIFYKDQIAPQERGFLNLHLQDEFKSMRDLTLNNLRQLNQKHQARIIDLSDYFSHEKEHVYMDFIHIKQVYKPGLADKIYQHILPVVQP